MSELRQDPISGQWVIIAPERSGRPDDFAAVGELRQQRACPFCAGNEHLTTTPLMEIAAEPGSTVSWRVRVLLNKYPAVALRGGPLDEEVAVDLSSGDAAALAVESLAVIDSLHGAASAALGHHEVVIESPHHLQSITELDAEQMADVVRVYRDRLLVMKSDRRLVCGVVFKNTGYAGGATLEHVHSQIVALPAVPQRLRSELSGAAQWRQRHGSCAYCALIEGELADGARVVAAGDQFVAIVPWAARMPYETWILPRQHESHFEQLSDAAVCELAGTLQRVVAAVEVACQPSAAADRAAGAYNYVIHSAPFDTAPGDHYHWHIEIIPRITRLAGFEWGTGWHINPVTPEAAALRLRKLLGHPEEKRSSAASLPIS